MLDGLMLLEQAAADVGMAAEYADLIARARRADELEQAMRWILVSERMPDDGELVQWYSPGNDDASHSVGKLDGSTVIEFSRDRYPLTIYTHWMPIPAPPASPY